jgi:HlyD family secretion protein
LFLKSVICWIPISNQEALCALTFDGKQLDNCEEYHLKKALIWLSILLLVVAAIAGWFWYQRKNAADVATGDILRSEVIRRGDLVITVPASGYIVSHKVSELQFEIPGLVQKVFIQVGDQVKAGDILATLDTRDLDYAVKIAEIALAQVELNYDSVLKSADEQDIDLAEIALQNAQQALVVANLNKELAAAQAALSNRMAREVRDDVYEAYVKFQETLKKYNLPYVYAAAINAANMEAEGNVGITALKGNYNIQQAQSGWWSAYNAVQQAQQSLTDLKSEIDADTKEQNILQIEQARLNLDQAQLRLEKGVITAPHNGTIAAVNITEGLPAPTQSLSNLSAITLLDNEVLFAEVSIDEIDIGSIEPGLNVEVILDAYPNTVVKGDVEEIQDVPSNLGGIISYIVRIKLTDLQDAEPRDGMTVSVFVETKTLKDIVLIPNWAIRTDQTTNETFTYCICMVDGTPTRSPIETGLRNDAYTQVLSGLEEGATVVLMPEERSLFDLNGPPSFGN